jgi:hypothetical protein
MSRLIKWVLWFGYFFCLILLRRAFYLAVTGTMYFTALASAVGIIGMVICGLAGWSGYPNMWKPFWNATRFGGVFFVVTMALQFGQGVVAGWISAADPRQTLHLPDHDAPYKG